MVQKPSRRKQRVILLSKNDADAVRGESSPGHELDPRQIDNDTFILGLSVLDDPNHAKHIPFLSSLRQGDILITEPANPEESQQISVIQNSIFTPYPSSRVYLPKGNVYDRPPFPEKGDWSESALYESIGRALSSWEFFERLFAMLFQVLIGPSLHPTAGFRAYGSIVSFTSRLAMVEAATEAYFMESHQFDDKENCHHELIKIFKEAKKLSDRRNDIAHGIVDSYSIPSGPVIGLALMPPDYKTAWHELGLKTTFATKPKYAYTSAEINFFARIFKIRLSQPTRTLVDKMARYIGYVEIDR